MQETSNGRHYLVALLLGIVGILIILIFASLRSQADSTETSATISNATPEILGVYVSDGSPETFAAEGDEADVNLTTESGTSTIYVFGEYRDNNGCTEVEDNVGNGLSVSIYRSSITGCGGSMESNNPLNCYFDATSYTMPGATCTFDAASVDSCDGGSDTEGDFVCTFHVHHFADATDDGSSYSGETWVANAMLNDGTINSATSTNAFELNTLSALSISTSSLQYGTLALDAISATSTIVVTNSGNNDALPLSVNGGNWACGVGAFSAGYQRVSTSSIYTDWASGMLSMNASSLTLGLSMIKQTSTSTPATSSSFWNLKIPSEADMAAEIYASSTLSGTCTTTLNFTAS